MDQTKAIPRMFHRRLVLLFGGAVAILLVLSGQLVRLSVVEGAERRARAEARLSTHTLLPTVRGSILDRRGRVLACDRPCYDVAVPYDVITGEWAVDRARAEVRAADRSAWLEMSDDERWARIDARRPAYERRIETLWDRLSALGGIDRAELDVRRATIKRTVQRQADAVWAAQRAAAAEAGRLGAGSSFTPRPIREQTIAHVLLEGLTDATAYECKRLAADLPGMLEVVDGQRRDRPWSAAEVRLDRASLPSPLRGEGTIVVTVEGVADHLLGAMRDRVYRADLERRPFIEPGSGAIDFEGYRLGDVVGARGLEAAFEDHLRGARGIERRRLDTDATERRDRVPGRDLHTTLDVALQARVQAILSPELGLTRVQQWHVGWYPDGAPRPSTLPLGTALNAAAVVLDVDTGEALALVTMPTLAMIPAMPERERAWRVPWINRPVQGVYPPGSIVKPLVLAAAATEGTLAPGETIECTGQFFPSRPDRARCWIYRERWSFATHGALGAEEAIARSCNIFFYTLADRLGPDRLVSWYRRFGAGEILELGVRHASPTDDDPDRRIGETPGLVPGAGGLARLRSDRTGTIIMGIGQGPVAWTPLHAANAYATLARGGELRDATLLRDDPREGVVRRSGELGLDPRAVRAALEGLRQSVMEPFGTGHHLRLADGTAEPLVNARGVTVWAKTGTAQAPPLILREAGEGPEGPVPEVRVEDVDHAWFVGLVGEGDGLSGRPEYAIAVLVEYGGSGGRAAGPIANQIILALQAEGYLPGGEGRP